jgi:seryl-tRNA synthetase
MFDIKWIRDTPAAFDAGLARRGLAPQSAEILKLDEERRAIVTKLQEAQSRRNAASKDIGKAKAAKDNATADKLMAEVATLKDAIASGEESERALDKSISDKLSVIPNIPLDEVPDGTDEKGNKQVRQVGEPRKLAHTNKPKEHFEIGEALGLMDFEAAGKVSGARFVYLKGQLARLERALANFMLDLHTGEFGYTEFVPPLMVKSEAMYGTGNLPKFVDDLFPTSLRSEFFPAFYESHAAILKTLTDQFETDVQKLGAFVRDADLAELKAKYEKEIDNLWQAYSNVRRMVEGRWLIPTSEVPLTNYVREQIIPEELLPLRFTAWTPCFRSEAGAAGRDTRGMIRQHQFSKVELVSITTPEQSLAEHDRMTNCAEEVLKRLGLSFRTMLLCTGDMGFGSRKTYDIEVWLPGQNAFREISSCSVCGDFQARRMGARCKAKGAKDTRFVHTLNGSGLAVGRTLVAVLENYQQADGSVAIPEVLLPYMGGAKTIAKA